MATSSQRGKSYWRDRTQRRGALLRREDEWRGRRRALEQLDGPEAGLLQPRAIVLHREDVAALRMQHHIEAEQHRQGRPSSVVIGDELRDEKHTLVAQGLGASRDQARAIL